MLKKIFAVIAALAVTLSFAPAVHAATTETVTTTRTTDSQSGVATITTNEGKTTTSIQIVDGGKVTKTISFVYNSATGDCVYKDGTAEWSYVTASGRTTIKSSVPISTYSATVSSYMGTGKTSSSGLEVTVYDSSNRVSEKHYTSPSGFRIDYYNASGSLIGNYSMTISTSMSNGIKFGTVTTISEVPASSSGTSNSSSCSNSGNSNTSNTSSNSNSSSKTATVKNSYSWSDLPTGTSLERAAKENLESINSLAKKNGWTVRKFKVKKSTSGRVVIKVVLKGKPDSDGSTWKVTGLKFIQTKSAGYFTQNGKTVSTSGVKGMIKNPGGYY